MFMLHPHMVNKWLSSLKELYNNGPGLVNVNKQSSSYFHISSFLSWFLNTFSSFQHGTLVLFHINCHDLATQWVRSLGITGYGTCLSNHMAPYNFTSMVYSQISFFQDMSSWPHRLQLPTPIAIQCYSSHTLSHCHRAKHKSLSMQVDLCLKIRTLILLLVIYYYYVNDYIIMINYYGLCKVETLFIPAEVIRTGYRGIFLMKNWTLLTPSVQKKN